MIKSNRSTPRSQNSSRNQELSRLLSAAVINRSFRTKLLRDPISAAAGGYSGESFSIGTREKEKLGAIHATNLADFAAQLSSL